MEKKTIGGFIAVMRKAKGMTQQELAEILNVSNKTVSRWERDECAPDLLLIPVLAELFEVTCDELLKGERISTFTRGDKPDKTSIKVEKQTKRLIKNAITRFKTAVWIGNAIALTGVILLFAISYGFYKPVIGFSLLMICIVASTLITIVALNKLNDQFIDNEIFDMIDAEIQKQLRITKYLFAFRALYLNFALIMWSMPFLLTVCEGYLDGVITLQYYWQYMPYTIVLTIVLYWIMNKYLSEIFIDKAVNKLQWRDFIKIEKPAISINVINGVWIFGMLIFVFILNRSQEGSGGVGIILLAVYPVSTIICMGQDKEHSRLILISALRNFLLYISFLSFFSLFHYSNVFGEESRVSFIWERVYIPIMISAIAIFGYMLLKRWLIKPKEIE